MKNWKIWCFLTELTAFLCCVQVAVFAKIAATQVNASGLRILGDVFRVTGAFKNSQILESPNSRKTLKLKH
jgi:hypothetical protein